MTNFTDVGLFQAKFDRPHLGDGHPPQLLSTTDFDFLYRFLGEELTEIGEAQECGDLVALLDGCLDLVWVAMKFAHECHLPFDEGWREVVRSNMEKVRATGSDDPRGKRGFAADVVKPEGWRGPDLEGVLRRHVGRRDRA